MRELIEMQEMELMPLAVNRISNTFPLFRDMKKKLDAIRLSEYESWDGECPNRPHLARIPFAEGLILLGSDAFAFCDVSLLEDITEGVVEGSVGIVWYHRIQSTMCPICISVGVPAINFTDDGEAVYSTNISRGLSFLDLSVSCDYDELWKSAKFLGMSFSTFRQCMSKVQDEQAVGHKTYKTCSKAFAYFESCIAYINLQIDAEQEAKKAAKKLTTHAVSPLENNGSHPSSSPKKPRHIVIGNVSIALREGSKLTRKKVLERKCTCWSVRGHVRHYKDGRTIWIKPYKKGSDRNGGIEPKIYDIRTQKESEL